MCCFSGRVERVEATRIFARMTAPGRQALVYQMKVAAAAEVAMVLPLPVPPGAGEDAVRWVALDGYVDFFADVAKAFPVSGAIPAFGKPSYGPPAATLEVVSVGDFVASFVPSLGDFARLDPRFRMQPGTIDSVPHYADWGFAVFQLGATRGSIHEVHPMAMEFPTRHAEHLFLPTLHVHDGALHEHAVFAHVLYVQGIAADGGWARSPTRLGQTVDVARSRGLIDGDAPVSTAAIAGLHVNQDIWLPAA